MWTYLKRLFKHRWQHDVSARSVLPPELLQQLTQSVQASEQLHSGEIRIYAEGALPLSYLRLRQPMPGITRQRALTMFGKLRVWDTADNNGVLIYLLVAERAIEIIADRGLNDKVSPATWAAVVAAMREPFHRGEFALGLKLAVSQVNDLLIAHFPAASGQANANELPNEPVVR